MWSYDDISIISEVIKQGSFIGAAKQLNIPSSTVSRRVSELEEQLDLRLLERTSRKLQVTDKGAILFEQCSSHLKAIKDSIQELTVQPQNPAGILRITTPTALGNDILMDWFCEFLTLNNEIELDVIASNHYEDILDERIDLAFRVGPLKDSQFIAQYLFSSTFIWCVSPDYLENQTATINSTADLSQHALLLLKRHEKITELSNKRTKEKHKVTLKPKISSNDISMLKQAALKGVGIACIPDICINSHLQSGELIQVFSDYHIAAKNDVYVVYPSKKYLPQKSRLFLEYIKNKARENMKTSYP